MKTKFLIATLLFLALTAIFVKQQISYPQSWDEIQLGMTKEEVYAHLGSPVQDGAKGAYWVEMKVTQRKEFNVRFSKNKVIGLDIAEFIGTDRHYFKRYPRVEQ